MGFYLIPADTSGGYVYDENTWTYFGDPFGAADSLHGFRALAAQPGNPDTAMIVAGPNNANAAFRFSPDRGTTWTYTADVMPIATRQPLQLVARTASELYAFLPPMDVQAGGIWRSTNGGSTWTQIITWAALGVTTDYFGMIAVASTKLFYSKTVGAHPVGGLLGPRGTYEIHSTNLDGSGDSTLTSFDISVSGSGSDGSAGWAQPTTLILRALSDTSVLVSTHARWAYTLTGAHWVSYPTAVTVTGTLMVSIGSIITITPETHGDPATTGDSGCIFWIYLHYDTYTATSGSQGRLYYSYQNDDLTWSALTMFAGGRTGALSSVFFQTIPCGTRAVQLYANNSVAGRTATWTGLQVSVATTFGTLWRVDSSGTVTDLRPAGLKSPWDVLPLSSTTWLCAGSADGWTRTVSVYRTTTAGSGWSLVTTVPASQGFMGAEGGTDYGATPDSLPLLAVTSDSAVDVAMLGAAAPTQQQIVWTSHDTGSTWTSVLNDAEPSSAGTWVISKPGSIARGPTFVPPVAIPARLATIVG